MEINEAKKSKQTDVIALSICADFCLFLFSLDRFAGTVGAIVTCPLEVVKTRLQSSSSQFYPSNFRETTNKQNGNKPTKGLGSQRDLCSSILRKRPQVISIRLHIKLLLQFI